MLFPTVMEERWGECPFGSLRYGCTRDGIPGTRHLLLCPGKTSRFVSYADDSWPPALPLGPVCNSVKAIAKSLEIYVCPEPGADLTEILLRINFHETFALEVIPRRRIRNVRLAGRR